MRNSHSRPVDPTQLQYLERKHARLKAEVNELGMQSYLTAQEEFRMRNLKKEKLRTKDSLESMRRDIRQHDV